MTFIRTAAARSFSELSGVLAANAFELSSITTPTTFTTPHIFGMSPSKDSKLSLSRQKRSSTTAVLQQRFPAIGQQQPSTTASLRGSVRSRHATSAVAATFSYSSTTSYSTSSASGSFLPEGLIPMQPKSPNHALQRTAPRVTLAASGLRHAAAMQPARRAPQSLSLGSLGNSIQL